MQWTVKFITFLVFIPGIIWGGHQGVRKNAVAQASGQHWFEISRKDSACGHKKGSQWQSPQFWSKQVAHSFTSFPRQTGSSHLQKLPGIKQWPLHNGSRYFVSYKVVHRICIFIAFSLPLLCFFFFFPSQIVTLFLWTVYLMRLWKGWK